MTDAFITIIGGGVLGTAAALQLAELYGGDGICLIEKNTKIPGENQSSRNSGVLHAGIYYEPGSKKAKACVEGNRMAYEFCRKYDIPHRQTGKLVVATTQEEDASLDTLLATAIANGVPGIRKISDGEITEREPNIRGYSALWVPTSGIVDAASMVYTLKALAGNKGVHYELGTTVKKVDSFQREFLLKLVGLDGEPYELTTTYLVNATGLGSDVIARAVNPAFSHRIQPLKGYCVQFIQDRDDLRVSCNVYPAPKEITTKTGHKTHYTGIHETPTFGFDSRGNPTKDAEGRFVLSKQTLVGPLNDPKGEYANRELPMDIFWNGIRGFHPAVQLKDLSPLQEGEQAMLENFSDFIAELDWVNKHLYNFVGCRSPGFTCSLALAQELEKTVKKAWRR